MNFASKKIYFYAARLNYMQPCCNAVSANKLASNRLVPRENSGFAPDRVAVGSISPMPLDSDQLVVMPDVLPRSGREPPGATADRDKSLPVAETLTVRLQFDGKKYF
jgi:hypothetical protein